MAVTAQSGQHVLVHRAATHLHERPSILGVALSLSRAVKLCLLLGANPSVVNDYGRSALVLAAMQGQTEVVQALLAMPDPPLALRDVDGQGAMDHAVANGHHNIAELLEDAVCMSTVCALSSASSHRTKLPW